MRPRRALKRLRGPGCPYCPAPRRTSRRRRQQERSQRAEAIERASRPPFPATREGPTDGYERDPRMTDRV